MQSALFGGDTRREAFALFLEGGIAYQRAIREAEARENPQPVLPSLSGCRVVPVPHAQARGIILRYEWLRTMGRTVACYGLLGVQDELLGVACFGWPSSPESRDICGREHRERAVCLERGACVHWAPKNAASYLIRHAVQQAHRDHGWEIFYAYADEEAGEIGTVYQASNWRYIGQGVGRPVGRRREDFMRPDGQIVSSRALRHSGITKMKALAAGWAIVYRSPKHKYVWFEGRRRRYLAGLCRYPFLPYPRRSELAA